MTPAQVRDAHAAFPTAREDAVAAQYEAGMTQTVIAAFWGLSQPQVSTVLKTRAARTGTRTARTTRTSTPTASGGTR